MEISCEELRQSKQSGKQQQKKKSSKRPFLVTGYFTPIQKKSADKANGLINCKVGISELEIMVRKLEAEKSGLQKQADEMYRLNEDLKKQMKSDMEVNTLSQPNIDKKNIPGEEIQQSKKERREPKKPLVLIAGDSMLREIKGWLMPRTNKVKVHSFPSATTSDMFDYLKPLLKKNPDHTIFSIGPNEHEDDNLSPRDITNSIIRSARFIAAQGIKRCFIYCSSGKRHN